MNCFRDLPVTARVLARSRGYAAAVILMLGLVIGANTAIFSVVYGVLLKPLPLQRPQDLVVIWDRHASRNLPVVELSYRTFEYWSTHSRSFEATAAVGSSTWPAILQGRGAPVRLASAGVSGSFFSKSLE
jgi:putative ABC transport system permease protein